MKRIEDFTVVGHRWLNADNYILEIKSSRELPDIKAGQFAELKVDHSPDVFLRRPISILDVNYETRTISFYIKIVGKGTRLLGKLSPGETISIIYPLGNSFSLAKTGKVLIVGGGSGIAPFILLGRALKKIGVEPVFLFGGRDMESIVLTDEFSKLGLVYMTTEDGSAGEQGLVTEHSIFKDNIDFSMVYTCGPDPMMKAIARIADQRGIPCEASLENTMACGFGACLCCIVETDKGNKCVCTDGPVFNVKELTWLS